MRLRYKKIKYSAGLISIIFLPILCISYLKITNSFKQYNVIEIYRPRICIDGRFSLFDYNLYPNRKYIEFYITGNDTKDSILLISAKHEMKLLRQNKDTLIGLHFIFDSKSKYWTYIEALDICIQDTANTYFTKDNNIFVFYNKFNFNNQLQTNCNFPSLDDMWVIKKPTVMDKIIAFINPIIEKLKIDLPLALIFGPSALLFIAMIVLTFRNDVTLEKGSQ